MSTTKSLLTPVRRTAIVTGATLALALGGATIPVATAHSVGAAAAVTPYAEVTQELPTRTITISETTLAADEEYQITVTGIGFNHPSVLGTRPPLPGLNAGAYVVFGKFADNWKPSTEGSGRNVVDQKWAMPQESADAPMLQGNPEVVVVDEDGGFTTTLTVSKDAADAESETGNYGIFTYAGAGVTYAPYETEHFITFTDDDDVADTGSLSGLFGSIQNIFGS